MNFDLPRTPLQKLDSSWGPNTIYMKRDDLLPFSLGGNKVRIAFSFFKDMKEQGKNAMIVYGDRRSNLCRVLANLCAAEKVPCVMIATSEHAEEGSISVNERITRSFPVTVYECGKTEIAETVDRAFADLEEQGYRPYYIYGDRYGKGNEGTAACAYAPVVPEILRDEAENGISFDYLVTACGTGSTFGGLISGVLEAGTPHRVLGISISSRSRERAEEAARDAVNGYFLKKGLPLPSDPFSQALLTTDYNRGGYGMIDESVAQLADAMMLTEGIPLDPVYTAKAFSGMLQYFADNDIRGKNVLFLHTGGLPLYMDALLSK